MDIVNVVKEHPVPVGLGVFIVLILIFSRSSNTASVANSGAAAAMNGTVQLAGLSANTSVALGAQSVQNNKIQQDAANARFGIASGLLSTIASFGAQTEAQSTDNAFKIVQSAMSNDVQKTALADDLTKSTNTINANVKMNADNLSAGLKALVESDNNKINLVGAQTQGSVAVIQAGGNVASDLKAQDYAFYGANLSTLLQHSETLTSIQGKNQIGAIQAQQQAANTTADAAARAQNAATSQSWLSSIGSFVSGLF
jgi:hypothetical protein